MNSKTVHTLSKSIYIFLILFSISPGLSCNNNEELIDIEINEELVPDIYNKAYFVDSQKGSDSNSGFTKNRAWKTLSRVSSATLVPGDHIYFKKGNTFRGHLVINGSGTQESPIVITSYGTGNQPIISGEVGAEKGGDYQEAIYVNNKSYITFDDLEIQNERLHSRDGVADEDAYGIHIHNSGADVMKGFTFKNMTFKNVYSIFYIENPTQEEFNKIEVAGLRIFSNWNASNGPIKTIEDILVEDCYFTDLHRLGVHIKHGGGHASLSDEETRNKNIVVRNNHFYKTGGTCVLPIRTYNCLIEDNIFDHPGDNSDPRMPNRGSAVWTWRCINTVIQNNQCLHIRGKLDSHGIHIDHENVNTFVQYNYMEDCEGGFVEILGGNINSVYRFNVSVNDGWRNNPNWKNSNHTLWINENAPGGTHYSDQNYIYNNTIYIDSNYATAIDLNGKNTHIYNNIFYAVNGANIGGKQVVIKNNGTPLFMKNNLFFGTVAENFKKNDNQPITGDPHFHQSNSGNKYGYQLNVESHAINAGHARQGPPIPGAGSGIFKNLTPYPTVDFYGNPIDLSTGTPNIGACNAKNGEIHTE